MEEQEKQLNQAQELLSSAFKSMKEQNSLFNKQIANIKNDKHRNNLLSLHTELMSCIMNGKDPFEIAEKMKKELEIK